MGKVVLLGAGPGELDYLTIKGEKALEQADCVIYDRLINPDLLSLAPTSCEKIFVGKENHKHTLPQDDINELLAKKAKEHSFVVRLKGGDPYVFGRGGEEALFLISHGIDVEVIPGISSSIAALASAGIPITHRGLSKGFQVITAHSKKDQVADIDYKSLTDETVTLVFLMGLAHVGEIADGLMNVGRDCDTPVAVISNATTNHQTKVVGTLADIDARVNNSAITSPAIIVVGDVVKLHSALNFFEKRPLFGKRYFLPLIRHFDFSLENSTAQASRNELKDLLIANGAEVFTVETGTISPIKIDLKVLDDKADGDYIVFTSANGVKAFFWNLNLQGLDSRVLGLLKVAAIGNKTAEVLRRFGIKADLVSTKQNGTELATLLNGVVNSGNKIYWFTAKDASKGFENTLRKDIALIKTACYENVSTDIKLNEEKLNDIKSCDGVIFTSGSNVNAIAPLVGEHMPNDIYSIGPACSDVIRKYGFSTINEASVSSYDGIMELLL